MLSRQIFLTIICIFMSAHSAQADNCADGYEYVNEECTECPKGRYDGGTTYCQECPRGYYMDEEGQTGIASCKECSQGKYGWGYSNYNCKDCPTGWWQDQTTSTSCKSCSDGYSTEHAGSVISGACKPCAAGKFELASVCVDCVIGKYTGQTGQTGNYESDGCTACATGYYQDERGQTTCEPCSTGSFQNQLGQSSCEPCAAGKYNDETGSDAASYCDACPTGFFQENAGKSNCDACSTGFFTSADGTECESCSEGKYTPSTITDINQCKNCEKGKYQDEKSQTSCKPCDAGKYNGETGSDAASHCENCDVGTSQNQQGQEACEDCLAGKYQDSTGQLFCKDCNKGEHQDETGQTSCKDCAEGKYNQYEGRGICTDCDAGKYNGQTGSEAESDCQLCPLGTTSDAGASECEGCPKGTYSSVPITSITDCKDCNKGEHQDETGQTSCKDCVEGTYNELTKQEFCKNCVRGKYNDQTGSEVESDCTNCPIGHFQDTVGSSDCKECQKGRYNKEEGYALCEWCASGFYQDEVKQTECKTCERGKATKREGSQIVEECIGCPTGKHNEGTQCFTCPRGKELSGSTCTICDIGKYSDTLDSNDCKVCDSSTQQYQDEKGQTECKTCPMCHALDLTTQKCTLCPLGKYSDSGVCSKCQIGKYLKSPRGCSSADCEDCPGHTLTSCYGEYEHIVFEKGTVQDPVSAADRCKEAINQVRGTTLTSIDKKDDANIGYGCGFDLITNKGYINVNPTKDSNVATGRYKGYCAHITNETDFIVALGMTCDGLKSGPDRKIRSGRIFGGIEINFATVMSTETWTPFEQDASSDFCQAGYKSDGTTCTECEAGKFNSIYAPKSETSTCAACTEGKYSEKGASKCIYCPKGYTSSSDKSTCESCPACAIGKVLPSLGCGCESCKPGTYIGFGFASVTEGKCDSTCTYTRDISYKKITSGKCEDIKDNEKNWKTVTSPMDCSTSENQNLDDVQAIPDAPTGCITYASGARGGKLIFNYMTTSKDCSVFTPCMCAHTNIFCDNLPDAATYQTTPQTCGENCNSLGKNYFSIKKISTDPEENDLDYYIKHDCSAKCVFVQKSIRDGYSLIVSEHLVASSIVKTDTTFQQQCLKKVREAYPRANGATVTQQACYAHFDAATTGDSVGIYSCIFTPDSRCNRECKCGDTTPCNVDSSNDWQTFRTEGTMDKKGTCTECLQGQYTLDLSNTCEICVPGKSSNELGVSIPCQSCNICLAGKYMTDAQTKTTDCTDITCDTCPQGYYQDETTQTECKPCMPNQYQDQIGKTSCKSNSACGAGKHRTYASTSSGGTCEECALGTFCQDSRQQPCPSGKYQDEKGQTSCKDCAGGKTSGLGKLECE